jgi:hypothetical protein
MFAIVCTGSRSATADQIHHCRKLLQGPALMDISFLEWVLAPQDRT